MKQLTVFTPTYNRGYCIYQLYESLLRQTSKGFIWLVIDDGSSDNTKELIQSWIDENKIEIQYIYQENQGMHGAHNTAYANIETELNVCIDSDDYMTDDAVEIILNHWNNMHDKENIAGLVGLDIDLKGHVIGSKFPDDLKESTLYDIYHVYKVKGDKKLVLRTEIVNQYPPYPIFEDERFVPLHTLYLMIDQDYVLVCLNHAMCVVEYMEDGSSLNIFKQYKRHPKGFRYSRSIEMLYYKGIKNKVKTVLHYISSTMYAGDLQFFKNNPKKILTFFLFPFGLMFHLFIVLKNQL